MTQQMNAIQKLSGGVQLTKAPLPQSPPPQHLLIRMKYAAISHGDKAFIGRPFPPGAVNSLHDIYGSSGVGEVIGIGEDTPGQFKNKTVTIYRSLHKSSSIIGTWCEYAVMHYLDCMIIPDDSMPEEYAGSLGNVVTSYAFRMLSLSEGHSAIISTAGSSATGITLLGLSIALGFPLLSIVRNQQRKQELEALGATHVLTQDEPDFEQRLHELSQQLKATAVYDGIGGSIINRIIGVLPNDSTIYSYGFMGDAELGFPMSPILFKGLTIKSFSNMRTETVQDPVQLEKALNVISGIIDMPHFKTRVGEKFQLSQIEEALQYAPAENSKAVLSL